MIVHIPKAKYLLLEVSTTTLSPSFWHYDVSTRDWGKVSPAWGLYYYIESQYLTLEVSTYHWGQVSTAKGLLLHRVPVSDTMMSVHMTAAKFLLPEVCTTTLSPSIWHMKLVHFPEAKGQYNYIVSKYRTHEVSTHHWDRGSTARGQYYYIESQYLTPWCQYTLLRQSFYCWRSVLLHWVPVSDNEESTYS